MKRIIATLTWTLIATAALAQTGHWTGKLITGTFTQHGMSFPMPLNPGVPTLKRPQTPVGPFVYANADVTFSNGGAVLKGTLTTPKNCSRETPVLIMVT